MRYRGWVRQIVSAAAVIGAVLGVVSCSAGTGQARHVTTVSRGRAGGSFPRECGFGGWPSTASQEGGFADARYAWAARHEWPGRRQWLLVAVYDLQAATVRNDGIETARDERDFLTAGHDLRQMAALLKTGRQRREARVYGADAASLRRFFGQTHPPGYLATPARLDRGCVLGVLVVPGIERPGYNDARQAWGLSNSPVGDFSGAGQGTFWVVAKFDLRVALEYDSLTPRARQRYRTAIQVLQKMSGLPDTGVTGHIAAEYTYDLGHLNRFFGTRGYV